MPEPTQDELTREFQAQLDQEFRAQRRSGGGMPGFLDSRADLPPEGLMSPSVNPTFQPDLKRGEAVGSAALLGVLGAELGGMAGAALLPNAPALFGASTAALGGEAVGLAGADMATRALTGQPQSPMGTAATALTPLAVRGGLAATSGVLRTAARFLPGFAAGRNEAMATTLKTSADQLKAGVVDLDELYGRVESMNPKIPTRNLDAALKTLAGTEDEIAQGLKNPKITRAVKGLSDLVAKGRGELSFQALRFNLRRLGQRIGAAAGKGEEEGAMKLLFKALQQDMERAADSSDLAAQARLALKTANAAARQRFAAEELSDLFTEVIKTRGDGLTTIDGGRLLTHVQKNPGLVDVLPAAEQKAIRTTLKALTQLPVLPPRSGVQFGSGPTIGRGLVVGGASNLLGADPMTASALGGVASGLPHLLSRLMVTEPGRAAVVRVLSTSPTLNHQTAARLAAVARMITPERINLDAPLPSPSQP